MELCNSHYCWHLLTKESVSRVVQLYGDVRVTDKLQWCFHNTKISISIRKDDILDDTESSELLCDLSWCIDAFGLSQSHSVCLQALCHGNVGEWKYNRYFLPAVLGGVSCRRHIRDCVHWLGGLIGHMVYRREHLWDMSYSWRCGWTFKSPGLCHVNGCMQLSMASHPRGIESSEQGLPLLRIVPSFPDHLMWCSHCTVWFMPALQLIFCICSSIFCRLINCWSCILIGNSYI